MATERYVTIHIEGDFDLPVADIWPDGDAPAELTAEAVRDLMQGEGPKSAVLRDWALIHDLTVTVSVPNPHRTQPDALIPEQAPQRWQTAEVWPHA